MSSIVIILMGLIAQRGKGGLGKMHRITVRRTVITAAQELLALAKSNGGTNPLDLADIKNHRISVGGQ
jgi:hypothetical protein